MANISIDFILNLPNYNFIRGMRTNKFISQTGPINYYLFKEKRSKKYF